ncbi:MAG: phosphomannomutase/phosphoglucomutase [Ignavibacteriales bacterium]|nr:phosphomannomutase/phosphoglucomutase [Ignavibacteriales bacterium]MCF8305852.1 phosphomannomutase/phosphoglucomutase [Ignavibacteriales bacterium]MCF8315574.1 phosphomannomutase/phosphoglucomutase [Ignavibacteriales bacterium]MCF8436896.1 phosphomannomutase/phosphoglucomutase [Ignavibacteriales bacterium]
MSRLESFKAYDIRGKVPGQLNEELAYKTGRAYVRLLKCKSVVIGRDVRKSSPPLAKALSEGITDAGADVYDLGLCGTEMVYFGTPHLDADGGVMITASHNPPEYNGLKFVKKGSVPMGYSSGLNKVEQMILQDDLGDKASVKGKVIPVDIMKEFITKLRTLYKQNSIKPLRVVVNAGNGCVGPALDALEPHLPIKMIKVFHEPDADFPNGVPNPLLPENRQPTIDAIKANKADLGVAWDGDYDRCFFFDENGSFIEGYYIVGLLAKSILRIAKGENIVHDPRLTWNTLAEVGAAGGVAVQSQSGHAFIKEKMREKNAVYGGEMSAHHYFRENYYSDSGLIPFVLILQLISEENKTLSQLVGQMISNFPCSGEINSTIADPAGKLEEIKAKYHDGAVDYTDGVSVEYENWRFNVRLSNTEPLIRLNVESRGDQKLMEDKTVELLDLIRK